MKPKWRWKWWYWFFNQYQELVQLGWRWGLWKREARLRRCLECGDCCGRYFCTCRHLHGTRAQREAFARTLREFVRTLPATKLPPREMGKD